MQTIAAMSALKAAGADLPNAMLGISEPAKAGKRNGLRDLLTQHGVALLDHDPNVGGRYSALTNVGLLPAAALGLDIGAHSPAARPSRSRRCSPKKMPAEVPAALGAALSRSRSPKPRASRSAC